MRKKRRNIFHNGLTEQTQAAHKCTCDTAGSVKCGPDVCEWRRLRDGIPTYIKPFRAAMSCAVYYTAAAFPSAARQLLPRSVPRPKQQTAQCTEMLPALLPFPLRGWWGDPSLLHLCPSPTGNQKCTARRSYPVSLHYIYIWSLSLCCNLSKNQ